MTEIKNQISESVLPPLPDEIPPAQQKPLKGLRIFVTIGIVYGLGISIIGTAANPTSENLALLTSILITGIYTVALYLSRKLWVAHIANENASKNAAIIAIANAFFIRSILGFCEQLFQDSAGSNTTISFSNFLVTIPWLVGITLLFIPVQKKHRFTWPIIILLSGLYEFIAEGWVNGLLIPFLSGQQFNLLYTWSDLLLFGFWQFAVLYSSIFLVIGWIFEDLPVPEEEKNAPLWNALKPLIWIIPYSLYFILLYL